MTVRILSCGSNWWGAHSKEWEDPLVFRRQAAWFNTTAIMCGRRRRDCHIYPGRLRFNRTSRFDPERIQFLPSQCFHTAGPVLREGAIHLLFDSSTHKAHPEAFVVTLSFEIHGQISFKNSEWHSPSARPIAVSRRRHRYEAMLLLRRDDWVRTDRGRWKVSSAEDGFLLEDQDAL